MEKQLSASVLAIIKKAQQAEITEHVIYERLAHEIKGEENQKILERISKDELKHFNVWKQYTKLDLRPRLGMVWLYVIAARFFGITFTVKIMEKGERSAQKNYKQLIVEIPETEHIIKDENEHEKELLNILDEEGLRYVGSIVLGLNDALVELTGALAGFTFALQNTNLIAVVGLITGIAASFSMAASEYLSVKTDGEGKRPVKAAVYTGLAYIITVAFLIAPYWLFENVFVCLAVSLLDAVLIILLFTFYVSVAKDRPFKKDFLQMAGVSLGVSALTFIIGMMIRYFLDIDI